ncbi:MAG: homoserine kinase [Anaerolineaceae bacterium]
MITVRVAPTTANLGPGFDCLAISLDLGKFCMETTFELTGEDITVVPTGWGEKDVPRDKQNLVAVAFQHYAEQLGLAMPPGLSIHSHNGIPIGCGMGSSAAAIVTGLLAADTLLRGNASQADLLRMAYRLEGHADNTTAALAGGLVILTIHEGEVVFRRVNISRLPVVIVRPEFTLSTKAARAALPNQVDFKDAIANLSGTALTIEALRTGDLDLLGIVTNDKLHQPYRLPLIPGAEQAMLAGKEAGAAAVMLSGAGPSLLAFTPNHQEVVAEAMQCAFEKAGLKSMVLTGWTANGPAIVSTSDQ